MNKNRFKLITCIIVLFTITIVANPKVLASETKVEYTMKKDKVTYKDKEGIVRGVVSFQYPEIKGSSSEIKKINDTLKAESEAYMQSETAQSLKDYTDISIDNNAFKNIDDTYYYKTTCKVTYNNNSIISLHMKNSWYAGGIYEQSDYGFTYDIKTGNKLGLKDVVSGDAKSIKNKIVASGKKYLTTDGVLDQKAYDIIKSYKLKDYKFYLSKNKVYICFESYELGMNRWDIFSIKSKFK
ncbi:hypothetical protein acsn021_43170 [Anaerocolumna cellulosilytica]|uniref:Uncharacterized protein n=1 Tax=Anaerocolumna cellulosilytica TaxID=433286 RepID=A0A6S6RD69_9FIRM|nr:DUF4163 domain-containing protein [Anaerocolumna cellulosilytica]MBB5195275.1 hypothetical protein [Anaerocolumna cellulosilytica]BCJ96748.1 hypothetical protein acsn021_43170 [Anaerocolumna cellulosilytica]